MTPIPDLTPLPGLQTPANGAGQCMGADALEAGYINGQKNDTDLECTSEDLDIGFAEVSAFRLDTKTGAGGYTPLPAGSSIPCTVGQQVFVITAAILENNAQDRYDIGVWINQSGGSALGPGGSCLHFNLINGENGSSDVDGDQCGDMSQGVTATVPLDTLQVTCQDNPSLPGQQVAVGACVGFQHQVGGADRVCPTGTAPGGGSGFRLLTTPGTTAKCKCEPLILPLDIKAVLRIVKQTSPDADPQSFEFNPSYSGTNFFLTDGQTNVSGPLNAGTHTVDEIVPAGWSLGTRTCVNTTGGTPHDFTSTTNGISIDLAPADDVTCTFNNTKQATITVAKTCVGSGGTFDFTGTVPAGGSAIAPFTRTCGQSAEVVAPTTVFGNYTITEAAETGWALTDITCTGGGANTSDAGSVATVGLDAGEAVTCTFTNTQLATITVAKTCVGGTGTFDFTGTVPAGGAAIAPFTRTCGQSAQVVAPTTVFGNYTITEAAETGWALTDITCTGGGANTSDAGATATIGLNAGENVTCTFTNTRGGTITIAKTCVGGSGPAFPFTATEPAGATPVADFNRTCGQSAEVVPLTTAFGTYTFTETSVIGFTLTDITCTGGGANTSDAGATATVGLDAGEDVVCTFTNTAVPEEGRITGGGTQIIVGNVKVSRGFTLHCDIVLSNNLEINWGSNNWHIDKPLDEATCFEDPQYLQPPPAAPFNTFIGEATGYLNGVYGSIVRFIFIDAGEPGSADKAEIYVWAPGVDPDVAGLAGAVLKVPLQLLKNGNIQAHYDQPHK